MRSEEYAKRGSLGQYLEQLVEEGYGQATEGGVVVAWERLYALIREEAHASSIGLLGLPPVSPWVPEIESLGTPRDKDFRIVVVGWTNSETRGHVGGLERIGAVVRQGAAEWFLQPPVWQLIGALESLATDGSTGGPEDRLRATGRIQALAKTCGAGLDDYLTRTAIVTADSIELELKKSTALGAPVIEVVPRPSGAPPEWLAAFDRFSRVQHRYDVSTAEGGMAHVVISPEVESALEPIKRMTGRLVASDAARAFLQNPYASFGEGGEKVLSPEAFDAAREAAGIRFKTLQVVESSREDISLSVIDPSGQEADINVRLIRKSAAALWQKARASRERSLLLFSWDGEEIELTAQTVEALTTIEQWLSVGVLEAAGLTYEQLFDLSAYSDRVVGFDGSVIAVPYVALRDRSKGWLPDNLEAGVAIADTQGTAVPKRHAMSADQLAELSANVQKAEVEGAATVAIPGAGVSILTNDARSWLQSFADQGREAERRAREPQLSKDPPPREGRPLLKILHNIEALDYGSQPAMPRSSLDAAPMLPASLRAEAKLLPHQIQGVAWLQHRYLQQTEGVRGCLLADDMGLGKTLQALCLLAWSRERADRPKPSLVVAPVSLLENWRAEIAKFLKPSFGSVLSLYGQELQAARMPADEVDRRLAELGLRKFLCSGFEEGHAIVLTTYETLRDYEFSIARVQWDIVVCDEAQKVKNPAAIVTRAVKALRADFKISCTGTPVENSLADLWCLFDFFQPGLLSSLNEFTRHFRRAIETRRPGHEPIIEALRRSIDPWIMRRMKDEVANLPPKYERSDQECAPEHMRLKMSPLQAELYKGAVADFRSAVKSKDGRGAVLPILHRLRMICSNPLAVEGGEGSEQGLSAHMASSPKLSWVLEHLGEIKRRNEKVIVFTEYREIQRVLQSAIEARYGLRPSIVNGSTSVDPLHDASRQRIIDQFQAVPGFNVIILSTTAVGFGVNIQAANHVIHFTRSWNPAKEDQATDRAYRIGQARPVHVYCPTVIGDGFDSFDQRLDELLAEKRALSRDMLSGSQELKVDDFQDL